MGDILAYIWRYSYLLQDKNPIGFGRWFSGKEVDLIRVTVKGKKLIQQRPSQFDHCTY
ncbi:MAG: hypothetical protein EXX96DRAFT_484554 [Benjaminiella poitrasii]|nr:MAG: hypothetical protein EXX96DRAFT_484554 [Benjaminiella poitrasii]